MTRLNERQIRCLVEEIGDIAKGARLVYGIDPDDIEVHADIARALFDSLMRVGWLADKASAAMGGRIAEGDVDSWLLPPAFQRAADQNENEALGESTT